MRLPGILSPIDQPRTLAVAACLMLAAAALIAGPAALRADNADRTNDLYQRDGTDPTFDQLKQRRAFPIGQQSTDGVTGSTIDVNNQRVERGLDAQRTIPRDIKIHTLCHSSIPRRDFDKWTRWYQEDGNTQVFRLFRGEHNVRNDRPDAARIEAFSELKWKRGGGWHTWEGTYTIVRPHACMIFQVKNTNNDWAVSIDLTDDGDIRLNHRRGQDDITLARNMIGRPFTLGIRDNGHDYQVFFNGEKVGEGQYNRPTGYTSFRWGMYDGTIRHDALIFVSAVRFQ